MNWGIFVFTTKIVNLIFVGDMPCPSQCLHKKEKCKEGIRVCGSEIHVIVGLKTTLIGDEDIGREMRVFVFPILQRRENCF